MALSVDYIYQFSLKLIRKNQSGLLSSTEWAYHWNDHQSAYFDDLVGRFNARNNSKEGPNTGLIENETILQKLSPFTKPATLTIASGKADKPPGFIFKLALRINGQDVIMITKDRIAAVNNSVIDPPSIADDKYYATEYEGYYSFLPNTVAAAELDYIATPENVKWNYQLVNNRQVYLETGSVQPLWDNHSAREITKRMLKNLGVSFHDQDFAGFGETVIQQGV